MPLSLCRRHFLNDGLEIMDSCQVRKGFYSLGEPMRRARIPFSIFGSLKIKMWPTKNVISQNQLPDLKKRVCHAKLERIFKKTSPPIQTEIISKNQLPLFSPAKCKLPIQLPVPHCFPNLHRIFPIKNNQQQLPMQLSF
jgi:hypothetical protein